MYIAIDIGGTTSRIAKLENLESLFDQNIDWASTSIGAHDSKGIENPSGTTPFNDLIKFPTPKTLNELQIRIKESLRGTRVEGVSLGIASRIDHNESLIINAPNISYVTNLKSSDILLGVDCPVLVENDAALAGLAEAVLGPGKDFETVAYFTLSTGVGGTRIINGKLDEARYSFEPGHQIIEIGGRENPKTGIQGSWEVYSSGTAFKDLYGMIAGECDDSSIWNKYAEDLAIGLHNISLLWSPDAIVLGGGIPYRKFASFAPHLEKLLHTSMKHFSTVPKILKEGLGDNNGLIGGFVNLRNSIN